MSLYHAEYDIKNNPLLCPKCNTPLVINTNRCMTSNPGQHKATCFTCPERDQVGRVFCSRIGYHLDMFEALRANKQYYKDNLPPVYKPDKNGNVGLTNFPNRTTTFEDTK